jgi:hypothetical protein
MLATVGKAEGDISIGEDQEEEQIFDEFLELLDVWDKHAISFTDDIHNFAKKLADEMTSELDTCFSQLLGSSTGESVSKLETLPTNDVCVSNLCGQSHLICL